VVLLVADVAPRAHLVAAELSGALEQTSLERRPDAAPARILANAERDHLRLRQPAVRRPDIGH